MAVGFMLLAAMLSGCVAVSRQYEGAKLPTEKLAGVEIGATTRQDVLDQFGPPVVIQKRDFEGLVSSIGSSFQGDELTLQLDPKLLNEVFIYEYRRVNRFSVLLILFNYFSSVDKSDRIMFFFGDENRLSGYGLSEGLKEL